MMYPNVSPLERIAQPICGMIKAALSSVKEPRNAQTSGAVTELSKEPDMNRVPAHHLSVGN